MNDYISRQAAIDAVTDELDMIDHVPQWVFDRLEKRLKQLPTADVAPVRHGHWTLVGWHKGMKIVECSCCKKRAIGSTDFCPNCGAKMDGHGEE